MRIGILGAFHNINFGDQLLLKVLMEWIHEKYPRSVVHVPFITEGFCDFKLTGKAVLGEGIKTLGSWDAAIWGGGGYFGEPYATYKGGWGWPEKWARQFHGVVRAMGRFRTRAALSGRMDGLGIPYAVMATGVGPVTTFPGRWAVRKILIGARWVTVRDQESLEWVHRLAPDLPATMDSDILLSLRQGGVPARRKRVHSVAVHADMTAWNYMEKSSWVRIFEFLTSKGFRTVLMAAETQPKVGGVQSRILSLLTQEVRAKVECVPYVGTASLMGDLRNEYDLILTTKLHAGIVAYTLGKIPISISTQVKAQRFFKQAGIEDLYHVGDPDGVGSALRKIEEIARDPAPVWKRLDANRERTRLSALKHRERLWAFLEDLA